MTRIKNKNIYVVTTGSYSDYQIVGVFESKVFAEDFVELYREVSASRYFCDPIEVGTFPLNYGHNSGRYNYIIDMHEGGRVINSNIITESSNEEWKRNFKFNKQISISPHIVERQMLDKRQFEIECIVSAKNLKHAVKIVNEKRIQLIAQYGSIENVYKYMEQHDKDSQNISPRRDTTE